MTTVAFIHIKGGVGKTTSAVNTAHFAAADGRKTLLVDLDAQGSASYILRVGESRGAKAKEVIRAEKSLRDHIIATDYPGLDVLPASMSLRKLPQMLSEEGERQMERALQRAGKRYDLVVVDAPAGVGIETDAVLMATDIALVPIVPSPLATQSFEVLSGRLRKLKRAPVVFGFFSIVDGRRRLHKEGMEQLRAKWKNVWDLALPAAAAAERVTSERAPIGTDRNSRAREAYHQLWVRVREAIAHREAA